MAEPKTLKLDVPSIPLDKIEFNDYNPNVMEQKVIDLLSKSIVDHGFTQPITLIKNPDNPDKYIIVDGAHRYKIVMDLGYMEIPSVIENLTPEEAKMQTIKMNRFRGNPDSIRMAELLADLKKVYSEEDLEGFLGYSLEEQADFQELLDFDIDALKDEAGKIDEVIEALQPEALSVITDFIVQLNGQQLDIIETALKQFGGDRSKALEGVCRVYLEKVAPEKLKQIAAINKAIAEPVVKEPVTDSPL